MKLRLIVINKFKSRLSFRWGLGMRGRRVHVGFPVAGDGTAVQELLAASTVPSFHPLSWRWERRGGWWQRGVMSLSPGRVKSITYKWIPWHNLVQGVFNISRTGQRAVELETPIFRRLNFPCLIRESNGASRSTVSLVYNQYFRREGERKAGREGGKEWLEEDRETGKD